MNIKNDLIIEATANNNTKIVKWLLNLFKKLSSSFDIGQIRDKEGNTVLHCAARNSNRKMIRLFIDKYRINTNLKNRYRQTPLESIIRNFPINVDKENLSLVERANTILLRGNNLSTIDLLLKAEAWLDKAGYNCLLNIIADQKNKNEYVYFCREIEETLQEKGYENCGNDGLEHTSNVKQEKGYIKHAERKPNQQQFTIKTPITTTTSTAISKTPLIPSRSSLPPPPPPPVAGQGPASTPSSKLGKLNGNYVNIKTPITTTTSTAISKTPLIPSRSSLLPPPPPPVPSSNRTSAAKEAGNFSVSVAQPNNNAQRDALLAQIIAGKPLMTKEERDKKLKEHEEKKPGNNGNQQQPSLINTFNAGCDNMEGKFSYSESERSGSNSDSDWDTDVQEPKKKKLTKHRKKSTFSNPQLGNEKRSESPDSGYRSGDDIGQQKFKVALPNCQPNTGKPLIAPKPANLQTRHQALNSSFNKAYCSGFSSNQTTTSIKEKRRVFENNTSSSFNRESSFSSVREAAKQEPRTFITKEKMPENKAPSSSFNKAYGSGFSSNRASPNSIKEKMKMFENNTHSNPSSKMLSGSINKVLNISNSLLEALPSR